MKKITAMLCIIIVSCNNVDNTAKVDIKPVTEGFNQQKRQHYLDNRNDASTWDNEMLNNDKQMIGIGDFGPFELGVFPVPKYELLGNDSFKGLGSKGDTFKVGGKTVVMNSFFVAKNNINKERLGDKHDEVFFHIIVLTDTLDTDNYKLNKNIAISRNHPDYLAQGFVKTKTTTIDYVAFTTAEGDAYAIINTRLFNLNLGKTIGIAPQKDGTLRSLQIKSPELTSETIIKYTENLIEKDEVFKFLNGKNTI